ncbi:hypothetical protein CRE_31648 [Caenorhabditis remanei]|uniref:HMG box domain-containing protein n=1 Tax=Caenorhabditis remanei TaxID=31234 RepID=E3NSQ1_CAERE|nr:hypothetical protein CRE_31648 [Caenorhabditis remanei]
MFAITTRLFASKGAAPRAAAVASAQKFPTGMKISPYAMYIKDNFKNDANVKNTELMKDLSVKWKDMTTNEKNKYSELSQKHNQKKINDFLKLSIEEQSKLVNEAQEKKAEKAARRQAKERREKRKEEGRPTVPPSAYALFIKEKLSGGGVDVKDKMKEAVAEWKTLSDDQKKKFTDEAQKLKDAYQVTIEKWEAEKKEKASK